MTSLSNIAIEGYTQFSSPTKTIKGGTTIYVKNRFKVIERVDLNIKDPHFDN